LIRKSPVQPTSILPLLGPVGVYAYIIGFAIPFPWDIPLLVLATTSVVAVLTSPKESTHAVPKLPLILVSIFLVSFGLSLLLSDDIDRSLRLSASMLPALLLFFMLTTCLNEKDIRFLYLSFSIVAFILATTSIWFAWKHNFSFEAHKEVHTLVHWSPILVSRNDLSFLSLIAPLSLVLILRKPRSLIGAFATLSIIFSAIAIVVLQSRGATLSLIAALIAAAAFLRIRLALVLGLAIVSTTLVVDALLGFPLTERFVDLLERPSPGRIKQWGVAWEMFTSAPIFGHGPHTFALFNKTPWPHNLYIEVLAEQGIIGLISILSMLVFGVLSVWRTQRSEIQDTRLLGAGVFGSIVGFCLSSMFELSLLREWVVIALFVLIGVITKLYDVSKPSGG
jgi:O-antigen ligase